MAMFRAPLVGKQYQLLRTHAVSIEVGDQLKTRVIKVVEAEISDLNVPLLFIGKNDSSLLKEQKRPFHCLFI
jgi:hypothetical protein